MSYFNFLLPKYCLTDLTYHNLTYSLFPSPSPAGGTITGHWCACWMSKICPVDKMFCRKNVLLKNYPVEKMSRRKNVPSKKCPLKKRPGAKNCLSYWVQAKKHYSLCAVAIASQLVWILSIGVSTWVRLIWSKNKKPKVASLFEKPVETKVWRVLEKSSVDNEFCKSLHNIMACHSRNKNVCLIVKNLSIGIKKLMLLFD